MTEGRDQERGVFGNLPRTRPGTRSPLRDDGEATRRAGSDSPERPARTAVRPPPPPPPPPPRPEPSAAGAPEEQLLDDQDEYGLDDLAWAGIAVAAEAATLAVRFLNRAMEAARDASERR
jgi:hypothetical protein